MLLRRRLMLRTRRQIFFVPLMQRQILQGPVLRREILLRSVLKRNISRQRNLL